MGPRLRGGDKEYWRRVLVRFATAVLIILAGTGAAAAHAVLLGSDPPHRAALASAPHHLVLRFNEPVTPLFVRLVDSTGRERALPQPAHAVDREVHAHLPPSLEAGTYVAAFRVVSADGHPVSGAIVFAIGGAARDAADATTNAADAAWRLAAIVNRAAHILCLFLAAGGLLFALLVHAVPGAGTARATLAAAAAATGLLGIALHGAALNGAMDLASAAFWRVALAAPQAASALASVGGLALAFLVAPRIGGRAGTVLTGAGAAFALGAAGVTGHSAAAGWMWWPVAALHLVAAGFWLGALPALWRVVRAAAAPEATAVLQRFSTIAVPAVAALAAAGAALALQRMHELGDLLATEYGRLVLAKIAGAALLVAIAARNKIVLTPALARGDARAAARLRAAIGAEIALMAGVVSLAALLSHTNPHAGHAHEHDHESHAPARAALTLRLESGERVAVVDVRPGKPGTNRIAVAFTTHGGAPFVPLEASAELALPSAGIEGLSVKLASLGEGKFAADTSELAVPGRWQLRIDALVNDFEKAIFRGEIEIR